MSSRLAVLLEEDGEHLLHLLDNLGGSRIQCLLGHGLFAAPLSANAALQGRIRAQERIDLDEALGPTQQGHENIDQFVLGTIFDGLLLDVHTLTDQVEDATCLEESRQGC